MKYMFAFLIISFTICRAQSEEKSGRLVHIYADSDTINLADTFGKWHIGARNSKAYYFNVINTNLKEYLVRYDESKPENVPGHREVEIEEYYTGERMRCSYVSFIEFVGPTYSLAPNVYRIDSGIWLFHDVFGQAFLSNSDTLYNRYYNYYFPQTRLYHISGKVDHRYFVMARQEDDLYFVLADLSNSPEYNLTELPRLNFSVEDRPISLRKVNSELFLIRIRSDLNLYSFEADTFSFKKTMLSDVSFDRFHFRDDTLYFKNIEGLNRYIFSYNDTTLTEKKILMDKVSFIDHDFRYALTIKNDSLKLYDICKEREQKSWDISMLNNPHRPIMQYPDIFVHIEPDTLGTSVKFPEQKILGHIICKAYPNPFNPTTVIRYSVPVNSDVNLSIYNLLGQKVAKLVSEKQPAGIYEVEWNAGGFANGIYFYRLIVGSQVVDGKIQMIK